MAGLLPQHVQDVSVVLHSEEEIKPSLKLSVRAARWLRQVFSDKSSRNLFAFLLINLSFAFVELVYGMWTNSLGLISDSFHMFFDCTALLAGLVATIVSRWPSNERFSYGYVRAEVIAGFVNALFLLFIAFFIFAEAIERAFEPPEVKHDRLMIISIGGFIVNLIGIFAFHHGGHGHSHGGHGHSHGSHGHSHGSHGHSHEDHGHSHGSHLSSHGGYDYSHEGHDHLDDHHHHHDHQYGDHQHKPGYGHSGDHGHGHPHGHSHGHSHGSHDHSASDQQIMQGIFLHILADTLGSVGVIISSTLIYHFGWMLADPLCSMFIAVLITLSIFPLMRDSLSVLMQRTPAQLDYTLPTSLQKIGELQSVSQIQEVHVWTLCSGQYVANIRVEVYSGTDVRRLQTVIRTIFSQIGIEQSYIEVVTLE